MNRKIISSIAPITIVALVGAIGFCFYQIVMQQNQITDLQDQNSELKDQNSELQNQLSDLQEAIGNVEIVALSVEDWNNLGGVMYIKPFNVTIQNSGTHDAYGITLNCKITGNQSNLFYDFYYAEPLKNTLDVIYVREARVMRVFIETSLELISQFSGCNLVASLMFDDIVLDEWIQVI